MNDVSRILWIFAGTWTIWLGWCTPTGLDGTAKFLIVLGAAMWVAALAPWDWKEKEDGS